MSKTCLTPGETLSRLHRLELAAADLFEVAVNDFHGRPEAGPLVGLQRHHEDAAAALQALTRGTPSGGLGLWDMIDSLVARTAELFGHESALVALQHVERHLTWEYLAALSRGGLPHAAEFAIQNELLPNAQLAEEELEQLAAGCWADSCPTGEWAVSGTAVA